jgi:hypothetical protein
VPDEVDNCMSRMEQKLNEADFFLNKLEKHYQDSPEVRYYLSAFISAARSVTWVMRSEYHERSGWNEWFTSKTPDEEELLFLKRINDLRVKTEKLGPIELHYMVSFVIPADSFTEELKELLEKNEGKNCKGLMTILDKNNLTKTDTVVGDNYCYTTLEFDRRYIALDGFGDDDILDICRKYYSMIKQLVNECELKFGT